MLHVASVGVPYLHSSIFTGIAADSFSADLIFAELVDRIDITVWDYGLIFMRAAPEGLYEGEIELPANSVYSIDVTTEKLKVKNKTAGENARYQIVGWY